MIEELTGQGLNRVDGPLKVTGGAKFSAEIAVANVAHVTIVESTIARGRVTDLDVRAAQMAPGVMRVITPRNAPQLPLARRRGKEFLNRVLQVIQDDQVAYSGQPIALVVADTLEHAQRGAQLVRVTYAAEAADTVMDDTQPTTPPTPNPQQPPVKPRGDFAGAFAKAPVQHQATYTTPREHHNPMEMHATIAVWHGDDKLTLYDSTQSIFPVRKRAAEIFGLPLENVRVISHFVGGGFGSKGAMWSHVILAAMAAKVAGRPTKLMLTRQQMFALCGYRPNTIQQIALGAAADGQLLAIRHDTLSQTSRYDEFTEPSSRQTHMLYACPSLVTSQRLMQLDVSTPTFMRAPGEASGTYAIESAMDELSYLLKMDPIALRLRNHADQNPEDRKPWSSKSLKECYARGAQAFGWDRRRPEPRAMRAGHWLIGMGMATATYPARQDVASASAQVNADGTAVVLAGSQELGTGTYTVMTQVAADVLGLPMDRVRFDLGDTTFPEAPGSGGSRTAATVSPAVQKAAQQVRDRLFKMASTDAGSPLYGVPPEQMRVAGGQVLAKHDSTKADTYAAILTRQGLLNVEEVAKTGPAEDRHQFSCHAFGAQFVEVQVDEELGMARVTRAVGAFAAGKLLNAKTARSQLIGGMIFGIGMALHEHTVIDPRTGRLVTKDLAEYHLPVHADVPDVQIITVDEEDPHVNPLGVKGIGEIGVTGMGAAIANAVYHATGKRVRELPITPDKLL